MSWLGLIQPRRALRQIIVHNRLQVIHGAGKINGEINEDSQLRQDVLTIKEAIFAI